MISDYLLRFFVALRMTKRMDSRLRGNDRIRIDISASLDMTGTFRRDDNISNFFVDLVLGGV